MMDHHIVVNQVLPISYHPPILQHNYGQLTNDHNYDVLSVLRNKPIKLNIIGRLGVS